MAPNFEISESQVQQLDTDGFLMLPGALPSDLLDRLREADERHRAMILDDESHPFARRAAIADVGDRRAVYRYNHMELAYPELILDLLACPVLMACSRLCGPESVPLTADVVLKAPEMGLVRWHQGPPHSPNFSFIRVGIYLDEAPADEDCLRFVPGTHRELQDISAMEQEYGWDPPEVVLQPAQPGDILLQHMMILHSSKLRVSPGVRRTLYTQYRSMDAITECDFYSDEWAQVRRDWMDLIVEHADPNDRPTGRISGASTDLATVTERMESSVTGRERAVYASLPTETDNYP